MPTTIELTCEQHGLSVHFLDLEVVQGTDGVTHLVMYDKRDGMVTLANYRRFPHFETKLSEKCLYSVLHSHLCRFAVRCTKIVFFEMAAAKLIVDMIEHSYNKDRLLHKLHSFGDTYFSKTTISFPNFYNKQVRADYWHRVKREVHQRVDCKGFSVQYTMDS